MAIKFGNSLDLNNNELLNAVIQNLAGDPSTKKVGLIWFDTTNGIKRLKVYDGTSVKQIPYVGEKASDSDKLGGTAAADYALREWVMDNFPDNGMLGEGGGIATLDEDGKVPSSQLPDYLLGQLLYGGTIVNNVATVSQKFKDRFEYTLDKLTIDSSKAARYEGVYFIATGNNSIISGGTVTGDWVVSDGNNWNKIDNTDAVSSVAGLTGVITADQLKEVLGTGTAGSGIQDGESGNETFLTVTKSGDKLVITPIIGTVGGTNGLATTEQIASLTGGDFAKRYTTTITAESNTAKQIRHNLGKQLVAVSLYDSDNVQVYADVELTSSTTLEIHFGEIETQTIQVVVIG